MLELTVLIISIIIIIGVIYYKQNNVTETFENYYLSACPGGYKSFYDKNGDTVCCNGNIVANRCVGDLQCTLNGKGTEDMPNCVSAILREYKEKGKLQCPSSMSSYYEDKGRDIKGCTNGGYNDTLNGPRNTSQATCKIYQSEDDNKFKVDSCYNRRMLDEAQCFGNNCTKQLIPTGKNMPILVSIGFSDNTGMFRTAYTRKSLREYINALPREWGLQERFNYDKNLYVAEVAKAYYIDRTMDKSEIEF
jgi:hypothetical protein